MEPTWVGCLTEESKEGSVSKKRSQISEFFERLLVWAFRRSTREDKFRDL